MIPAKPINRYELLNTVSDNDILLIVHGENTYNVNGKTLVDFLKSHPNITSLYVNKTDLSTTVSDINKSISDEATRAKKAEETNAINISSEITRAKKSESDLSTAISTTEKNAKSYTDTKISDLINGAPELLDTFKEVAGAIEESRNIEEALNKAIGTKANKTDLESHTSNTVVHITADERTSWNDANSKKHSHSNKSVLDGITSALIATWNNAYTHISDTVKHITSDERNLWNTVNDKVDKVSGKALSTNDYTTAEKEKLKGIATGANKYTLPTATDSTLGGVKIGSNITNSDGTLSISKENVIGTLGYEPGASGTSLVTGVKGDSEETYRTGKINITAANVGAATEVHSHTKSQITDFPTSMPASDVYGWAKQSTKPSYTKSEVGLGNVGNFKAVSTVASQGLTDTEKSNARANIGAGTSNFDGNYNNLTNKPTIPTNTWRGIQDNLTSTSTTDSLSANQGKVLKGLIDNKSLIQSSEPTTQNIGDEWLQEYS